MKKITFAIGILAVLALPSSAALVKAVGDFQPRFKPGSNGPTDASQAVSTFGVHTITYSGLISDFGLTANVDNARPFIGFDQSLDNISDPGDALADFVYIDNIVMTVGGITIWEEDFEGATLGGTSGNNQTLAGTVIQTANTMSSIVVDATTDPTAAAAFTPASGQFALLSTGGNAFGALRPPGGGSGISFASVPETTAYSISFDLLIVPEPSSTLLAGLGGLFALIRRKR